MRKTCPILNIATWIQDSLRLAMGLQWFVNKNLPGLSINYIDQRLAWNQLPTVKTGQLRQWFVFASKDTLKQLCVTQVMPVCSHAQSLIIQSNIQSVFNDQRPLI